MNVTDQGDFKRLIENAEGGGWENIDEVTRAVEERSQAQKQANDRANLHREAVSSAWRTFAGTPEGARAIQDLCDKTINVQSFVTHMGLSLEQVAMYGAHREGANQIVWNILKLIAEGEPEDKQPKKREAKL